LQIVENNMLINKAHHIQLNYYKNPNHPLEEGAYWYIIDADFLAMNINIKSGEYHLYNSKTAEYITR